MIQIEKIEVFGWQAAIRGLRNPMNSWDKSDTVHETLYSDNVAMSNTIIGKNDLDLMIRLIKAGTEHRKFLRMINVTIDITAPLYWWKEFDTYKVGTVANSCSTMHKIHEKPFTFGDFSIEHIGDVPNCNPMYFASFDGVLTALNEARRGYLTTNDKNYWWQMIQLLPSSYNQKRTVQLNYEVLLTQYHQRKGHKLDEWNEYCKWIESLPYMAEFMKA